MNTLKRLVCILSGITIFTATDTINAEENVVSYKVANQKVIGTLETPEGSPAPVVLLLHGFTGSRDELPIKGTSEGVFSRTARLLAENGFASLRIDCRGSGESDGAWADTTFSSQTSDAVAAIDWLKRNKKVDGSRISLVGWSQGGLIASHAAKERPEVRAVVLWAPVALPLYSYSSLLGADIMAKALTSLPSVEITAKLPWGGTTTLKAAFYQELPLASTAAVLAGYDGPLLVIVGSKDTVVTPQPAAGQVLLKYHDGKEKLTVFETDHAWGAFSGPETIDEKMVPETLKWLRDNQ